jgi:hypothetical protein
MVTFGPEVVAETDAIRGINFNPTLEVKPNCRLENNLLQQLEAASTEASEFEKRWNYIRSCVQIQVTEMGRRPLVYPANQPGCTIVRMDQKSAFFNGGHCLFTPSMDSQFNVKIQLKKECSTIAGLRKTRTVLQSLEAGLSFYTAAYSAKDDQLGDLAIHGSIPVRILTNPVRDLFPVTDDFGMLRPMGPSNYPLTDIHFGKIEFRQLGESQLKLMTPLLVNNRCDYVEKKGLTSSVCSYPIPVVASLSLINAKGEVEWSWADGGVAPSQWHGILNGEGFDVAKDQLRPGERYTIEATFSDPYQEYLSFKRWVRTRLPGIRQPMPGLTDGENISSIPTLQEIEDSPQLIDVPDLPGMNLGAPLNGLSLAQKRLASYFTTTFFPPMYENVCHPRTGKCSPVGNEFLRLKASFILGKNFALENVVTERSSPLLSAYRTNQRSFTEYQCH